MARAVADDKTRQTARGDAGLANGQPLAGQTPGGLGSLEP